MGYHKLPLSRDTKPGGKKTVMRIKSVRFLISLLMFMALIGAGLLPSMGWQPAFARCIQSAKYKIYCVNGRIEVDSHSLAEMKSSRGQNVCQLTNAEYESLSDARVSAKQFGGIGA